MKHLLLQSRLCRYWLLGLCFAVLVLAAGTLNAVEVLRLGFGLRLLRYASTMQQFLQIGHVTLSPENDGLQPCKRRHRLWYPRLCDLPGCNKASDVS